ncbi:MAG TPA: helicase HerA-like domain-containing protein [Gaiellaceae bacterium]
MVGAGKQSGARPWYEGLPEGSFLLLPVALIAFLPLVLAAALTLITRSVAARAAVILAAAISGGVLLFSADPSHALAAYRAQGLLYELARTRFAPASLVASLPVGLAGAALLAAAAALLEHVQHPFWIPRERERAFPALSRRRELRRLAAGKPRADGRIGLGLTPDGRSVSLAETELAQHALIVGATGSGKTTSLLQMIRALVARGAGTVVADLKADPELAESLAGAAAQDGRPFEHWTLDGPSSWNPLSHGSATELTDKLVALEEWTEPHYKRAAQRYLHTVLSVLIAAGETVALPRVVGLLDPEALAAYALSARAGLAEPERLRIERFCEGLDRSSASAVQGLANRLALLAETNAGSFLSGEGIDLARTLAEGRVTLFSLDAQTYGETAAQVAALVVLDLKTLISGRLAAHGGEPRLAFAALDEFSAIRSDHLVHLFARGRSAGLGVVLATQELADLSRVDRGFADQVLANTNVKLIHRQDVPESAERLAALAGTRTVYEEALQTERAPFVELGASLRPGGGYGRDTGRGTIRPVEEYLVHPNELMRLGQGRAILIRKHPEVSVERVEITPPRQPRAAT